MVFESDSSLHCISYGHHSQWFNEDGIKLSVIGIFVIVGTITIDKPGEWCYICHEQDRSKNEPL